MEFIFSEEGKYRIAARKFLESFPFLDSAKKIDLYARSFADKGFLLHEKHYRDCVIAATALAYNIPLVTANVKDFIRLHKDLVIVSYTQFSTHKKNNVLREPDVFYPSE